MLKSIITSKSNDEGAPDAHERVPVTGRLDEKQQCSLIERQRLVTRYFPSALGVDDFMARLEMALSGFGFTGENSIAITNLCRDEVTVVLKDKIEAVFGSCFNTNGLGAILTCGLTGMGAGQHHSPISNGKEHYVYFAFPHISIDASGEVGAITRPGRPHNSNACGALCKCLGELKQEGYASNCKVPGVHDPLDPEYSILKQRLARRMYYESTDVSSLDLVALTQLTERTITADLEYLIEKAVDPKKANYAVVTGVQIHNWATELTPDGPPSIEFIAPASVSVVVDGRRMALDLRRVPTMAPRQLQLLAAASTGGQKLQKDIAIGKTHVGTLKEIPYEYLTARLGMTKDAEALSEQDALLSNAQGWQAGIILHEGPLPFSDERHSVDGTPTSHTGTSIAKEWENEDEDEDEEDEERIAHFSSFKVLGPMKALGKILKSAMRSGGSPMPTSFMAPTKPTSSAAEEAGRAEQVAQE